MTIAHRFQDKYQLEIRADDDQPAPCHLVGEGVHVVIDVCTLKSQGQWPAGVRREVMRWIEDHMFELWNEWKRLHQRPIHTPINFLNSH